MTDKSITPVEAPGTSKFQVAVFTSAQDGSRAVYLGLRLCDMPGEEAAPEGNTVSTVLTLEQATDLAGMLLHAVASAGAMAEVEGHQGVKH